MNPKLNHVRYLPGPQGQNIRTWEEPDCYDLNLPGDRRQMYGREMMQLAEKRGNVEIIANELFEMTHPDREADQDLRKRFTEPIIKQGDRFGKWFYFPWSNRLVQYPDEQELRQLLTFRNREMITAEEQRQLGSSTVAHIGLSVGMKVLRESVHMGLGKKVILADYDNLSIANLNRMDATMEQAGMRKTDIAGIHVSELNPFIQQVHFPDGITEKNAYLIARHQPNIIYEHVDHLPTKALIRKIAQQAGIPLVMATDIGDYSLIDVERHDKEHIKPFLGKLSDTDLALVEKGDLSKEQTQRLVVEIIGYENISVRMAKSLGHIGLTLGGIAQLGTTAAAGAAYAAVAGRSIVLGRGPDSGRFRKSPQEIMGIPYL